jgi:hypothetical protein
LLIFDAHARNTTATRRHHVPYNTLAELADALSAYLDAVEEAGGVPKDCLRTGDRAKCIFRFLQHDEYIHPGSAFVFREGSTKGLGKITRVAFTEQEAAHWIDISDAKFKHRERKQRQAHPEIHSVAPSSATATISAASTDVKTDDTDDIIAAASVLHDTRFGGGDKRTLHSHLSHTGSHAQHHTIKDKSKQTKA